MFILGVLAFTWIGQFPLVASEGAWSPTVLRSDSPVPPGPAIVSGALVALAVLSLLLASARRARALLIVRRSCRDLTAVGGLVVLDDDRPEAFITPRPAGRIIVTTGLLRRLNPQGLRVLLAHETSHLTHHHTWWTLTADLAAAVNPLLRPAARAVATAVERWADEDAARSVGDRRLVAATLVRVAQLQSRYAGSTVAATAGPAATGGDIVARVRALLAPPPRRRPLVVTALIVGLLAGLLPAAAVQHTGEGLFEHAAQPQVVRHA
ncbi:M56 family peptidase [Kribbella turkmenica]|uniref:M56 family peptidase n=1 Tax=Kribbella turkmenica TaxID=2530375 RepID=A0A4R4X8G1_9ACTN|nr:M56 family peptidase [Kribbella turkmenica]